MRSALVETKAQKHSHFSDGVEINGAFGQDESQEGHQGVDRDHEDNANDVSLINGFRVVQEVLVDMEQGQSNGSACA